MKKKSRSKKKRQSFRTISFVLFLTGLFVVFFFFFFASKYQPKSIATETNKNVLGESNTSVVSDFCMNAPTLLYHHIQPYEEARKLGHEQLTVDSSYFEQHIQYLLSHGYRLISAEELVHALREGLQISEKVALITIDDGYLDAYEYAFAIAKKYNVKINLIIPSGLIEQRGYVTWDELKEMVSSGLVYVVSHTWSHVALTMEDAQRIEKEIIAGKYSLEQKLGLYATIFAYPYGALDDRSEPLLRENGFQAAFSTRHSFEQCRSKLYRLSRNHVGNAPLSSYGL